MNKIVSLYIMRHAEAEPGKVSNAGRQLTSQGEEDLKDMCKAIEKLDIKPEVIFTSAFDRAISTGKEVGETVGVVPEECELLNPTGDPEAVWDELFEPMAERHESIMLITHEPLLKKFCDLALGVDDLPMRFKQGSIMRIDYEIYDPKVVQTSDISVSLGDRKYYPRFRWFVTPAVIRKLL